MTHGRISQLDGIRTIAILAVFLHHSFHVRLLWMGVDLFFILSGFLITGILLRQKTKPFAQYLRDFYGRRVRRILPPYLLLLVVTTIIFGFWWMRHGYLYLILMNVITALQIPQPETLSVLWSLAVEEQFYLIWPIAVFFLSEASLGWMGGALLVIVPVLRGVCTPLFASHWPIYALTPFRMDLLVMGGLLAIAWRHHRSSIERYGHLGLVLPLVAGSALIFESRRYDLSTAGNTFAGNVLIYELSLVACTGLLLWALSGRWVGILKLAPIRYLGRISYSVYLIHLTALYVCRLRFQGITAVALAMVVTVTYAALSWHLMEEPLLGRNPKEASVVLSA